MTIFSFMSVGWGQSITDNYTQEIVNISDKEVMIISNHEMEGYTFSDTTYISVSRLLPPCDEGYTEIEEECYYQSDLDVLQIFIDNSDSTLNMEMDVDSSGVIEPLELGDQNWSDGRITNLSCYNVGLSGNIPESIGNLSELLVLRLSYNNELSGLIPSGIGNLTNLFNLELFNNQLIGEIPPEIVNLTNLHYLIIKNNQLYGNPNMVWNLTELQQLHLNNNQFTGEIPESIGNLINLKRLWLNNNQFIGEIPESIGNLSDLRYLSFSNNQFSGEIPESIGNLINLDGFLYFFNNQFTGEIPESIGNLSSCCDRLWLDGNQLSGEIPGSICELSIDWGGGDEWGNDNFRVHNNNLCPPYPECIEDYVGYQDTSECEEECPDSLGDLNSDTFVNIFDIIIMVNCIINGDCDTCSDLNQDGSSDILDIIEMVNYILYQ